MSSFRHSMTLLATYLRPQWKRTLAMVILLLASIGLQLINPQILRYFIDMTVEQKISPVLIWSALLFLAASILNQVASVSASYLCDKVAWTATNLLRTSIGAYPDTRPGFP
jgi:ATP-binding cassette, subfamily B, bacterial